MPYKNKLIQYENGLKQKQLLNDFNVTTYKRLNHDLQHMTDEEAINHYKNHGFYENRIYRGVVIPSYFDVSIYKKLNPDLQHMTDKEAINHYKIHGFYEGRKYYLNLHNVLPLQNPNDISMFLNIPTIEYSKNSLINSDEIIENFPRREHNAKKKIDSKLLSTFLLIIDFNNLGGGTTVFIESIVARYKKYKTFLE
jgi:hypothetical protein